MREYRLISADSHINEPPDLWTERVPAKFKDRAPRMISMDDGDAWIVEGAVDPLNFGMNVVGGMEPERHSPWITWHDVEELRPGGFRPSARVVDMEKDGVDFELLYPSPRLSNSIFWHTTDKEFHLAGVRAYNDWLSEFCSHDPSRLGGVAMMPNVGAELAAKELERAMSLPGMRTAMLGQWPHGGEALTAEDDLFFAAAQELDVPISIHVGFVTEAQGHAGRGKFTGSLRLFDAPVRATQLINGGVFDRFPQLRMAFVEVDCGWVPYVKEQMDDRFKRGNPKSRPAIKMKPSEYLDRNVYFVFITDSYGVVNRHHVGLDRMMWSSDFPHAGTDWPNSQATISEHFKGVPQDEKYAILAGNALRAYKLDS